MSSHITICFGPSANTRPPLFISSTCLPPPSSIRFRPSTPRCPLSISSPYLRPLSRPSPTPRCHLNTSSPNRRPPSSNICSILMGAMVVVAGAMVVVAAAAAAVASAAATVVAGAAVVVVVVIATTAASAPAADVEEPKEPSPVPPEVNVKDEKKLTPLEGLLSAAHRVLEYLTKNGAGIRLVGSLINWLKNYWH